MAQPLGGLGVGLDVMSGDGFVGGEGFFEAVGYVGHFVKSVGVFLKAFERELIDHGGIVEVEQFHVFQLFYALVDDVDVGIFFTVGAYEFFYYDF